MIQQLHMMKLQIQKNKKTKKRKKFATNFNQKNITYKIQNFYILFTFFTNYYQCLLFYDKVSSKTKTFTIISQHIANQKNLYIGNINLIIIKSKIQAKKPNILLFQ